MPRTIIAALLLCAVAGAGEAGRLELARLAMEAKIKEGDVLREKGDLDGALRAYQEAVDLFRDTVRPDVGPAEPHRVPRAIPEAVKAGLRWLAAHQDVETTGGWDADEFTKHDPPGLSDDGAGKPEHDVGVTGLALLAFLDAGYTDRGGAEDNPYARNVRQALRFLMTVQDDDGFFGARISQHAIYGHAIATLAMAHAYRMTRNPLYRKPAQTGVEYILHARNPYLAWRYNPRSGENDTSVTSWCVAALKAAEDAGIEVDPAAYLGARAWVEKMTDPASGRAGYIQAGGASARLEGMQDRFPPQKSESMTAAAIHVRLLTDENPASEMIRKGADLVLATPPDAEVVDMVYWLFGTLAMERLSGVRWEQWRGALSHAALPLQRPDGSWDPSGAWGPVGGRVYATAVMTACMARIGRAP